MPRFALYIEPLIITCVRPSYSALLRFEFPNTQVILGVPESLYDVILNTSHSRVLHALLPSWLCSLASQPSLATLCTLGYERWISALTPWPGRSFRFLAFQNHVSCGQSLLLLLLLRRHIQLYLLGLLIS